MITNKITLRSSLPEDFLYIIAAEEIAAELGYVALWKEADHLAALTRDKTYHMIIMCHATRVGYLIMNRDHHDNLELMRLVITDKHKGYGRQTIKRVKKMAFEELLCNRLWLDVRIHNQYAYEMYQEMDFVKEGVLRNCVKFKESYLSAIVMSILKEEYEVSIKK